MKTIHIIRGGEPQALANVAPDRTLLEVLREDLGCTSAKEGCGEGDCGACTVVLAELADPAAPAHGTGEARGHAGKPTPGQSLIRWRAINSCIRLAHSVDGMAVFTAQDLGTPDGPLHPAQQAMVDCHGSQCGFCTPGFVMSLFGLYRDQVQRACGAAPAADAAPQPVSRELAQQALSGNLCRCTGYRPILDAAQRMHQYPVSALDEAALAASLQALKQLKQEPQPVRARTAAQAGEPAGTDTDTDTDYLAPTTLKALLAARAAHPRAQVVAGCTDVGLWVTKQHRRFSQVLDVTRARELRRIEHYPHHIAIGAAVTLHEAYAALVALRPQLAAFAQRFAGLPVRQSGTLGGNVANGSPIGDSMPLLIALGASVVLMSVRGHRELPLEALYTGYRTNVMAGDELLAWIKVPRATPDEFMRVYKISKRYDDDISAVCMAVRLRLHEGRVAEASIGLGGVAATPVRARQAEAALLGQPWGADAVRAAQDALGAEFRPISDMRASAAYRQTLLRALMQRFWLESQGLQSINLESITRIEEVDA